MTAKAARVSVGLVRDENNAIKINRRSTCTSTFETIGKKNL
jgi:hypothetical protein